MPGLFTLSLKKALIAPFIVVFLCSVGTILWLQKQRYDDLALDVSEKQLSSLTTNVVQSLDIYLDKPMTAVKTLAHAIEYHELYTPNDATQLEAYLRSSFATLHLHSPQIDLLGFGGEQGEFLAIRAADRSAQPAQFSLMVKDAGTDGNLLIYADEYRDSDILGRIPAYDPRERPWYLPIRQQHQAAWSEVYTNADAAQEVTISALAPVFQSESGNRHLVGVAAIDVQIDTFRQFLTSLNVTHQAKVYVIDANQALIAQSNSETILDSSGQRRLLTNSHDPMIQRISRSIAGLSSQQSMLLTHQGEQTQYIMVSHYQTHDQIDWYVVVVISAADLMGDISIVSQHTLWVSLVLGLLGMGLGIFVLNRLTVPLSETAKAAKQIANGSWDYPLAKRSQITEVSQLLHSFSAMRSHLQASFHALREQLVRDNLTKLYSRQGFIETCDALKAQQNGCGTMLLIGINQFRDINDSLGHHYGDVLLTIVAERLKAWVLTESGVLGRVGGDEFAIYLPNLSSQEKLCYQHRLKQIFAAPFVVAGEPLSLNISMGVAYDCDNADTCLRNAGIALSHAKTDNNRISVYTPVMAEQSKNKTRLLTYMRHALDHDLYEVYFQPLVDIRTGAPFGAEALLRLRDQNGQFISPLSFIPLAESSGLIKAIGQHMAAGAMQTVNRAILQGKLPPQFQLHINVSVLELADKEYIEQMQHLLEQTGFPAEQLTVEITESQLADNDPIILTNMAKIKALGVSIAIDDFGTGYSSLAYLHKLPFDSIKIDKAFIDRLTQDNVDDSVVAAITKLSRSFGFSLLAEGVETPMQAELIRMLGCHHAQGYLFSPPLPLEQWPSLQWQQEPSLEPTP
ncbi:bifunctional diguanylate cyclase/phosphodiesterase [Vibrio sp. 10N]|uniref:bifunctional diguanylate cyclase/phosphodiesterase n=1 Tax=Vibrio sp. 10N TaxID=3058938 RepID=UPI002813A7DF|nr:EAL domain-containing protein [Vibrio sp. 10N]